MYSANFWAGNKKFNDSRRCHENISYVFFFSSLYYNKVNFSVRVNFLLFPREFGFFSSFFLLTQHARMFHFRCTIRRYTNIFSTLNLIYSLGHIRFRTDRQTDSPPAQRIGTRSLFSSIMNRFYDSSSLALLYLHSQTRTLWHLTHIYAYIYIYIYTLALGSKREKSSVARHYRCIRVATTGRKRAVQPMKRLWESGRQKTQCNRRLSYASKK